ncbi:hypothetical protein D6783_01540 [Candidatus Woesearchaeota archaeon]|nr:MAG: hypothetical protein D6783_01540 [Candidatus Woesearchaeota archaeon]
MCALIVLLVLSGCSKKAPEQTPPVAPGVQAPVKEAPPTPETEVEQGVAAVQEVQEEVFNDQDVADVESDLGALASDDW